MIIPVPVPAPAPATYYKYQSDINRLIQGNNQNELRPIILNTGNYVLINRFKEYIYNIGIELSLSQNSAMIELLQDKNISKNFNKFSFVNTNENEICIIRSENNSERAIIIGTDVGDIYFLGYAGLPPKRTYMHLDDKDVTLEIIKQNFTLHL